MKRLLPLIATALLLTACGGSSTDIEPTTTAPAPTSSVTASPTPTTTPSETPTPTETTAVEVEAPAPDVEQPAAQPQVAPEPYVIECLPGTPGPARWSDGSMRYSQYCWDTMGGAENAAAEGAAGLPAPAPVAPAPQQRQYDSSGEAQAHAGCQNGTITNPALCGQLYDKYGQ